MSLISFSPIFTQKGNGKYIMEINDKYFTIDEEVKLVMQILETSSSYSEAVKSYNNITKEMYSEEEFIFYSEELLKNFNHNEKTKSFLLIEKTIFPPKLAGKLASILEWFFNPVIFWTILIALSIFSIYVLFFIEDHHHEGSFEIPIIPFILLYGITIFFHELGHIAACKNFTGKNGEMGVGIYLIYPVFYSNISPIWHATQQQRIITNLAGVYMQLWFVPILFSIGIYTENHFFEDFIKTLIIFCFIQLLPFIRSDGYWLLSDIFNIPNLLRKSQENLKHFFKNPIQFFSANSARQIGILIYGITNTVFVILFAYYQLRYNYHALLNFPMYLWGIIRELFAGNWKEITFNMEYFTAILFYYILYVYAKILFKNVFHKNEIKEDTSENKL